MFEKIPKLGNNKIRESYTKYLNNIFKESPSIQRSYLMVARPNLYPEIYFSPKDIFDDPFKRIEFIKLSKKDNGTFIQIDFYREFKGDNVYSKLIERKYKIMKTKKRVVLFIKPLEKTSEVLSELEYIAKEFAKEEIIL